MRYTKQSLFHHTPSLRTVSVPLVAMGINAPETAVSITAGVFILVCYAAYSIYLLTPRPNQKKTGKELPFCSLPAIFIWST